MIHKTAEDTISETCENLKLARRLKTNKLPTTIGKDAVMTNKNVTLIYHGTATHA